MQNQPPLARADASSGPEPSAGAKPYGLIGLTVGSVLILAAGLLLCVLALAAAFGIAALLLGHAAIERLANLQAAMAHGDEAVAQAVVVVLSLVFYASVALAVLGAARLRGGRQWRDIVGWHAWNPFRRSRLFWAVAVGAIVYNVAADALISRVYPPSKAWVVLPHQPLWATLFITLAVVFAPITEELLFRGWLYAGLRVKIGVLAGNIVSAALFALAHWEDTHLYALAVFPVGLALGFIRERSGSLKASMAFHAVYNAAASAFLVFAS